LLKAVPQAPHHVVCIHMHSYKYSICMKSSEWLLLLCWARTQYFEYYYQTAALLWLWRIEKRREKQNRLIRFQIVSSCRVCLFESRRNRGQPDEAMVKWTWGKAVVGGLSLWIHDERTLLCNVSSMNGTRISFGINKVVFYSILFY